MSEYIYKEEGTQGGLKVQVVADLLPENPRQWDNLGTMLTWTRRYMSPDKNPFFSVYEFDQKIKGPEYIMLPVYKYEHGGIAYSTQSFIGRAIHAEWDSGQVGYIYASRADIREWFGVKRVTKAVIERAKAVLSGEVETYSAYANGDVYGYRVLDEDGIEVSSCYGFYDIDECLAEGLMEA